jgi:hypothetical protein
MKKRKDQNHMAGDSLDKLFQQLATGELKASPATCYDMFVRHNDWCGIFRGGGLQL